MLASKAYTLENNTRIIYVIAFAPRSTKFGSLVQGKHPEIVMAIAVIYMPYAYICL